MVMVMVTISRLDDNYNAYLQYDWEHMLFLTSDRRIAGMMGCEARGTLHNDTMV